MKDDGVSRFECWDDEPKDGNFSRERVVLDALPSRRKSRMVDTGSTEPTKVKEVEALGIMGGAFIRVSLGG